MALITRTCPHYAGSAKRKLKVSHILSVRVLSYLETNTGRDTTNLEKKVHWILCKKFEIECEDRWFLYQQYPVVENDKCKILWGFAIQTDKEIEHWRPDIVVIDKKKRECKIINIAVPGDQNIKVKELEQITKYQDLRLKVQKLWDVNATVIPIVVGALGTVSEELEGHLKTIGIPIVVCCLQKAALLGTAFILRRVLDISESG